MIYKNAMDVKDISVKLDSNRYHIEVNIVIVVEVVCRFKNIKQSKTVVNAKCLIVHSAFFI